MTSPDAVGRFATIEDLTPPPPPRRRPRWLLPLVGVVAVAVLIGVGAYVAVTSLLGNDAGATRVAYEYVPDDAMLAVELRLDLPAGQREQLVEFAGRFPEFDDAQQVERRLTELLDEAVETAFSGRADYATDIEPWFDGWVVGAGTMDASDYANTFEMDGYAIAMLGHHDRQATEAALEKLRGQGDWTSNDHAGTTVWTRGDEWQTVGYAVTDDVVVMGMTEGDVELALDTRNGSSSDLLDVPRFADHWQRLPAGRVGALWMDYRSFMEAQNEMFKGLLPEGELPPNVMQLCTDMITPSIYGGALSFADGNAVLDSFVAYDGESDALRPDRDSGLDRRLPGDTFVSFEMHDVGAMAGEMLDCLRDSPMAEELAEIEKVVGSIDAMVGWAGDAAVAGRFDGSRATVGLVVTVTDEVRAAEAMGQLRAALVALAGSMGSEEVVSEEMYGDVRIVHFDLGDVFGKVPAPAPDASFSYAFDGDLLVMGVDASFTKAVLDVTDATSLRANETYRRAVESAGGFTNSGIVYVDLEAVMRLVDSVDLPQDAVPPDARKYLDVFESFVAVSKLDGDVIESRLVLTTNE